MINNLSENECPEVLRPGVCMAAIDQGQEGVDRGGTFNNPVEQTVEENNEHLAVRERSLRKEWYSFMFV